MVSFTGAHFVKDVILTCVRWIEQRDERAASRFLTQDMRRHGVPDEMITFDGSEANAAAIRRDNTARSTTIVTRRVKHLNNILEQDQRALKRVTRPMPGFKSFDAAQCTLAGIELRHMLKKGQMVLKEEAKSLTPGARFYALAA